MMPLARRRFIERLVVSLALVAISILGTLVAHANPDPSSPSAEEAVYEVTANVGGQTLPATVGAVFAAGRKVENLCVFDQEVGVHINMVEGDVAPTVTWKIDEQCRLVIVSIVEPASDAPAAP